MKYIGIAAIGLLASVAVTEAQNVDAVEAYCSEVSSKLAIATAEVERIEAYMAYLEQSSVAVVGPASNALAVDYVAHELDRASERYQLLILKQIDLGEALEPCQGAVRMW